MTETLQYFNGDELAANVWLSKYAAEGEKTPDQMHMRMAKEFARIEDNYSETEIEWYPQNTMSKYWTERKPLNEERIYSYFKDFKYIIPQGSIMSTLGTNTIASLSNCYVVEEPGDSYGHILKTDQELAQLYKRRGGVGTGISKLRPAGTPTTNTAKSSTGAVSFMERFSNTTREVAMNGRRGALMLTIDIRHPDVEQFIDIKKDRTKVTGANISIKIRDDFMEAVRKDEDYILRFPCDQNNVEFMDGLTRKNGVGFDNQKFPPEYGKLTWYDNDDDGSKLYMKRIKARELWNKIITAAHESAEPGLLFVDRAHEYSTDGVYPQYRATNTNP